MELERFDKWFAEKVHCFPFPNSKTIIDHIQIMQIVINCYGTNYDLFHRREYKIDVMKRLTSRKDLLDGKGGFFMFPIQRRMSLENLCNSIQIAMEAYKNNLHLYLHCRSGLHRSEMVRCGIYFHVKGVHLKEIGKSNMLIENVKDKHNMFPVSENELEQIILGIQTSFTLTQNNK